MGIKNFIRCHASRWRDEFKYEARYGVARPLMKTMMGLITILVGVMVGTMLFSLIHHITIIHGWKMLLLVPTWCIGTIVVLLIGWRLGRRYF